MKARWLFLVGVLGAACYFLLFSRLRTFSAIKKALAATGEIAPVGVPSQATLPPQGRGSSSSERRRHTTPSSNEYGTSAKRGSEASPAGKQHSAPTRGAAHLEAEETEHGKSPAATSPTSSPGTPGSVARGGRPGSPSVSPPATGGWRRGGGGGWQSVSPSSSLQLYSAFYDDVASRAVRMLGLGLQSEFLNASAVWCHVWEKATSPRARFSLGTAKAFSWKPKENSGVFVLCPLRTDSRPYAVSVTMKKTDSINNWIPIKYPNATRMLSVCFPAVNGGYTNVAEMVQTIELDRILGAEKFFIYDHSSRPKIKTIMAYYEKKGILEVLPWHYQINGTIHYFGQNIALNDCMYRNLHESEFVAVKDLDEVIVPEKHPTLLDLIKDIKSTKTFSKVGSIMARNAFFWKFHSADVNGTDLGPEAQRLGVQTVTEIWRQRSINAPGSRSKQLVLPERVIQVAVHTVHTYRPGYLNLVLPPGVATSHHHHNAWSPQLLKPENLVRDDTVRRKYGSTLLAAVRRVYEDMKVECKCEEPW